MKTTSTKARLEPGKRYHVYTRGNNRETIFKKPENYPYFLKLWKRHVSPIADTYAYCLLANHVHFCIEIKHVEFLPKGYDTGIRHLSKPFSNCFNAYTKAINKRYERKGSLFEETYNRKEIADETYFIRLMAYIHANPQHHGFCEDFRNYPYSSYHSFLSNKPTNLMREEVLYSFGDKEAFIKFHADHQNWNGLEKDDEDLEV